MNFEEAYYIAEQIKAKTEGLHSIEAICKAMGVELVMYDLVNLKGMYSSANRHRTVFLNSRLVNYYEKLTTLYHEIGHDQIPEHRKKARQSILMDYSIIDTTSITEREANVVAAHVLLDDEKVIEYLMGGHSLEEATIRFKTYMDLLILKLEEMKKKMGRKFPFDLAKLPRCADPTFLKGSNGIMEEQEWNKW